MPSGGLSRGLCLKEALASPQAGWQAHARLSISVPGITSAVCSQVHGIHSFSTDDLVADGAAKPAALSGGLSRGLCLINKALASTRAGGKRSARPRMLCLQGSPDATEQYIAVMNSIFAAQVSVFMQCAAAVI